MNISLVLERSRLPISSLIISQLLLGYVGPSVAQSLPDSNIREEPAPRTPGTPRATTT